MLEQGLSQLRLDFTAQDVDRLLFYIKELEKWNKRFKLVKADSFGLVVRHILDSLAALPLLAESGGKRNILDVGAGAGLPAIPLAVFLKDYSFTLCERSATKAAFLRNVSLLLGLAHVQVVEADLKELEGNYDTVIFRAVGEVVSLLPQCERLLSASGMILAYKGTLARLIRELDTLTGYFRHAEIKELKVPFLAAERHALVLRLEHRLQEF